MADSLTRSANNTVWNSFPLVEVRPAEISQMVLQLWLGTNPWVGSFVSPSIHPSVCLPKSACWGLARDKPYPWHKATSSDESDWAGWSQWGEDRGHPRWRAQQGPGLVDGKMLGQGRYWDWVQGGGPELPAGVPKVMGRQGKEGQTGSYKEIGRETWTVEEERKRSRGWR